jgi:hypothetical protein
MKESSKGVYSYLSFQRFKVIYSDVSVTVKPETDSVAAGDIVNFSTTLTGMVNEPMYVWSFEDGTEILQGNLPEMPPSCAWDGQVVKKGIAGRRTVSRTKEE